jgi:hypothetical protein
MSKTTNKLSLEVRARAVRMILDHEGENGGAKLDHGSGGEVLLRAA